MNLYILYVVFYMYIFVQEGGRKNKKHINKKYLIHHSDKKKESEEYNNFLEVRT